MNSITRELKDEISKLETIEERLNHLRGKYRGKKAVILAPGPSLNNFELVCLYNRDDIVILSIKQAYSKVKGQTDFHIVNTYNFDKYNGYDYDNLDCIIYYGLSLSFLDQQMEKLAIKPHPVDIWTPVVNPPSITYEQCIHKAADFDKLLMLSNEPRTWWGTSILYEQAIPMALLLGCTEIYTVGWDLGTGAHSYSEKEATFKVNSAEVKYTEDSIKTTKELYDWLKSRKLTLQIVSDTNPADSRFKRISPCQI